MTFLKSHKSSTGVRLKQLWLSLMMEYYMGILKKQKNYGQMWPRGWISQSLSKNVIDEYKQANP